MVTPPESLADLVKLAQQGLSGDISEVIVRRGHVLEDALRSMRRSTFNAKNELHVRLHASYCVTLACAQEM